MNRISTVASSFKKINFNQIFTCIALTAVLFLATLFNNDYANAAANQSKTTYPTDDNNVNGLLYSDSDRVESLNNVDDVVNPEERSQLLDPAQIPAKQQTSINRADPNARLLEKTKQMFDDAANFSGN